MQSIDGVFASLAFVLGLLMARTTLCSVANIQQWVDARKVDGLLRLLVVTCASGLVLLAMEQLAPGMVRLPRDAALMLSVIAGGVLLGVGALVNGGCFLGTVLYIGRGNANFLATVLGLVIVLRWPLPMSGGLAHSPVPMPLEAGGAMPGERAVLLALGIFAGTLLATAAWLRSDARSREARASIVAAAAAGAVAGIIYAGHPDWNYASVLESLAYGRQRGFIESGALAGMLVLAGATVGSLGIRRWQFVAPQVRSLGRCFAGGLLMGQGARLIPGGHDLLLLWTIPGLALHGLVAFTAMALTVWLALSAVQRFPARPR